MQQSDHIHGSMSNHQELVELRKLYSPYQKETYDSAFQRVNEINPTLLSGQDYFEWLELKCNIAEAGRKPCSWIEDVEQWAQYADREGSDRDILAAHLHLSEAYRMWDYKKYGHHKNTVTMEEADSIHQLCLQELLFCVYYKEKETLYAPPGDYLLLKARAYSTMAKRYWTKRTLNYFQIAVYTRLAAQTLKLYLDKFPHCDHRKEIIKQYEQLLCDAAMVYRNCGENHLADECGFEYLGMAQQTNSQEDICQSKALLGSITVQYQFISGQAEHFDRSPDFFIGHANDALSLINEAISQYPKDKTVPPEFYHYKAMAMKLKNEIDSAYHYIQLEGQPTSDEMAKEANVISALYKMKKGDAPGAAQDYAEALQKLERTKNRLAQSHKPVSDEIVRQRINQVIEGQQSRYKQSLIRVGIVFLLLLGILVWFSTRRYRKMRQLHNNIEELNRQLDQLRAAQLQKQVTTDSLDELPPCDNKMEEVFCQKMQMKKAAFSDTPHYKSIMQHNMRIASSCNPESAAMPIAERHQLMDAILAEFSVECQQLRELCPELTGADAVYCMLNLLDCGRELGADCMEVSQEAYRRRKSRLKSKLSEPLFALFFGA